ncbi:MAG: PhoH family protein [Acidobacteriota bacterium]|jgi:PhoH-like ATPase
MSPTYVLDTNVLLHDPNCLYHFKESQVVIPIWVIEEIDRFKRDVTEIGRNARHVSRELDALRQLGPLSHGVPLEGGGTLTVAMDQVADLIPPTIRRENADNLILGVALSLKRKGLDVVLVTKDTNLRVKADALDVQAEDYESNKVQVDDLYNGWRHLEVSRAEIDRLFAERNLALDQDGVYPNEMFLLTDRDNPSHTALARHLPGEGLLQPLDDLKPLWGIMPRNREQRFALDLLLNERIPLVTLVGKAGTGKTLLALAAGLFKVSDAQKYQKLLVTRPIFPLGRDVGFLPGELEEKLRPWMQPIFDNLELLLNLNAANPGRAAYQELVDQRILQIEALTYIRGRSIPAQFMIVDEAQNLTPHEVKTIITRAGEQTKIVLTGDPYQIDNPYIDSSSNGLTFVVEKFKNHPLAGHVTLVRGERSPLAEAAANAL